MIFYDYILIYTEVSLFPYVKSQCGHGRDHFMTEVIESENFEIFPHNGKSRLHGTTF